MATKYFSLSFQRSGTKSLNHALVSVGIKSLHFPQLVDGTNYQRVVAPFWDRPNDVLDVLMPVIEAYDGHTDVPWPGLYSEIMTRIPDSRFILVTRDAESWWRSLVRHWSLNIVGRKLSPFERIQFWKYLSCDPRIVFRSKHKDMLVKAYTQHIDAVRRDIPPERLLSIDLLDPEKENKLQAFLQSARKPEFPHLGNQKDRSQAKRIARNISKRLRFQLLSR
jgi:hypothetical protein